ncbi:hypothetical protein M1N63_02455, partial [Thermodesulfovibrionales bacterium]|nr:hypothetical protein [Thermodesulfovibrionales bacterium]
GGGKRDFSISGISLISPLVQSVGITGTPARETTYTAGVTGVIFDRSMVKTTIATISICKSRE